VDQVQKQFPKSGARPSASGSGPGSLESEEDKLIDALTPPCWTSATHCHAAARPTGGRHAQGGLPLHAPAGAHRRGGHGAGACAAAGQRSTCRAAAQPLGFLHQPVTLLRTLRTRSSGTK
jgi:hypothetical protein